MLLMMLALFAALSLLAIKKNKVMMPVAANGFPMKKKWNNPIALSLKKKMLRKAKKNTGHVRGSPNRNKSTCM